MSIMPICVFCKTEASNVEPHKCNVDGRFNGLSQNGVAISMPKYELCSIYIATDCGGYSMSIPYKLLPDLLSCGKKVIQEVDNMK